MIILHIYYEINVDMKTIIKKYLASEATDLERNKILRWLNMDEKNIEIFKKEIELYIFDNPSDNTINPEIAFQEFKNVIEKDKKVIRFNFNRVLKYAAILIIGLISAYFIKNNTGSADINHVSDGHAVLDDTNALDDKIILLSEDGSKQIIEENLGEISYIDKNTSEEALVYSEIIIPKGRVFRLVLSDSTVVWLNSNSKLRYPKKFIKKSLSRSIELEGEAFLKVAHNAQIPFVVKTNGVDVEVLGTQFNVSSYPNDKTIKTTLIEGSVKVVNTNKRDNFLVIKPSYQASFNKEELHLQTKKVNTLEYVSWINKRIVFDNTPFNELTSRIERTYNVEIINQNNRIENEHFTGEFDIETIDVIFKALSASAKFEYEINDNIITIKPN